MKIELIETHIVENLSEALAHTSRWMNEGLEGAILKDKDNIFCDHTSPTQLKLKVSFNVDVRITGFTEGKKGTKREATFGAIMFETDDGRIKGQTSGFTDKMIQELHDNRDRYINTIIEVEGNDLTKGKDNEWYAISHPRFITFRDDKDYTDTLQRAIDALGMAKQLSN